MKLTANWPVVLLCLCTFWATIGAVPATGYSIYSAPDQNDAGNVETLRELSANSLRQKRWFVGFTYPGVTVGYQGRSFGLELRGYQQNETRIYGPRFTHYLYPFQNGNLYWGVDLYSVTEFEGGLTEGDGRMAGGFIGVQKFFGERFSFTLDSGPYYIKLEDDLSGLDTDGVEFVINTGLNVHF